MSARGGEIRGGVSRGGELNTPVLITANLAGVGTLTATAVITIPITASLAGAGTLTATPATAVGIRASLTGSGSLTATIGPSTVPITTTLTGAGTLSASLTLTIPITASLTGTGTLTATTGAAVGAGRTYYRLLRRRQRATIGPRVLYGGQVTLDLPTLHCAAGEPQVIAPLAAEPVALAFTGSLVEPARIPEAIAYIRGQLGMCGSSGVVLTNLAAETQTPNPLRPIRAGVVRTALAAEAREPLDLRMWRVSARVTTMAALGLREYQMAIRADQRDQDEEAFALLVLTGD